MLLTPTIKLFDIRFHGRAGQGVVTASRLLGEAAILNGKWVHEKWERIKAKANNV